MTPAVSETNGARVRRAVVPAAGRGTRLAALRGDTPKELMPVGGVPMLFHGLIDLVRSGIEEILLVIAPGKAEIQRALAQRFETPAPADPLAGWWPRLAACRFHFPVQQEPRGLADAVACAAAFLEDEPYVCYLPDNVFVGPRPATAQALETFTRFGRPTAALAGVRPETAARFGNCGSIETEELGGPHVRITHLGDKGTGAFPAGQTGWRTCGLTVLTREFLEINATLGANAKGEWDDVPILQRLAAAGRLYGHRLDAECLDAGNPAGYAAADAVGAAPLPRPEAADV